MHADRTTSLPASDLSELGLPMRLARPIRLNPADTIVAEEVVRPTLTSTEVEHEFVKLAGFAPQDFALRLQIYDLPLRTTDDVIARTTERELPLVVRRGDELIVNFDLQTTQAFQFSDSKRPMYTYIPRFNIQKVPTSIRRPLSNFAQVVHSRRKSDGPASYRRLPLTDFEFVILLLNTVLTKGRDGHLFQWPSGKRSAFVSLHDVDTGGFLRRQEHDPLFRVERKHGIRSTWFIPTAILRDRRSNIEFLLESGNEVGWHGHNHDHRLPFEPFATQRVEILKRSYFARPENFPTGMRTPKLLKSNHLYDVLDRTCMPLQYDTSFLRGIAPYRLWVNGKQSRILEIPTTVPTDIRVYNELHHIARSRRPDAMLEAQIARTQQLLEVGGLISIVTHPEADLSERAEFLSVYDRYLSYIKTRSDIWFATSGELFRYWTGGGSFSAERQAHSPAAQPLARSS